MAASVTIGLTYSMGASVLKAAHPEPFSDESVKTKIFILQVNNKITDTAEASEGRKIRYDISLLREPAVKWTVNYIINTEENIFQIYVNFKVQFLK